MRAARGSPDIKGAQPLRRLALSGEIIDSDRRRRRRSRRRHLFVFVCVCVFVREFLHAPRFVSPRQRSTSCQNQDVVAKLNYCAVCSENFVTKKIYIYVYIEIRK